MVLRFLNGKKQNYGVTVRQRMIRGISSFFKNFFNIFFKSFEFRAKKKYYKGGEKLPKMVYSCWAVAKQLLY